MIYTINHKSPDLDSTASAIMYARYKNKITESQEYRAISAGELNKETKYILGKINFEKPEIVNDISEQKIILVDHNEFSQAQTGVEKAKIQEVLDHHKVNFTYNDPIAFEVKPWGATCSIIADKYFDQGFELNKQEAMLLLAGILVDTVITKSPTCTEIDKLIIEKLAEIAQISDWRAFGMEIFKVRSDITDYSNEAIIKNDFKDFEFKAGKFGIGQIETADLTAFTDREDQLLEEMKNLKNQGDYHSLILFITDILQEGSQFLVISDDQINIEKALNKKLENNRAYVPGIMSRKKQVVPMFMEVFGIKSVC